MESCPFDAIKIIQKKKESNVSEYRGVLVFGEQIGSCIQPVVYELIGKGRQLADTLNEDLYCVVPGKNIFKEAEKLKEYGVNKVFVYDDHLLEYYRDDIYADIISSLAEKIKPNIFLIGGTSIGRSLSPRIASKLKTGLTADCTGLEIDPETGLLLQTRPAFGGNIMATIICPDNRPQIATVRYKIMERAEKVSGNKYELIKMKLPSKKPVDRNDVLEIIKEKTNEDIIEADIIISGGNGLGKADGFNLLKGFAECIGGVVGASRVPVDRGWIDYKHQIGLSGKTVRPKLYIACGVSGSIQHLAGMGGSDFIIAINNDENAPIFEIADVGLVGDLYEIIPDIISKLKSNN